MPRRQLRGLIALLACLAASRAWSCLAGSRRGAGRSGLRAKLDDLEGVVLVPMDEDLATIEDMKPPPLPELKVHLLKASQRLLRGQGGGERAREVPGEGLDGSILRGEHRDRLSTWRFQAACDEVSCPRRLRAQAQESRMRVFPRDSPQSVACSGQIWAKYAGRRHFESHINHIWTHQS